MKKIILFHFILILSLLFILGGCKKKIKDQETPIKTIESFFNVQNGVVMNATFPESTSEYILENVVMNRYALSGGASVLSFESIVKVDKILIGVQDIQGYFEIIPTNVNENLYNAVLLIDQELTERFFVVQLAVLNTDGLVSKINNINVELITAGTGKLQVTLSFNNNKDLDLHLIEPNGTHIFYGNKRSENGGLLDVDSNTGCVIDSVNLENIYYSDDAFVEPGLYKVYVDMWWNCNPSLSTNYVLSVFYKGLLIQTATGSNPITKEFPINEPNNYGQIALLEPVLTFKIPDDNIEKPIKKFDPLPLSESAQWKLNVGK